MKRVRQFIKNIVMLGTVTVFMRSVAVVFNAYVSGKIGAEGMGLYALITGIYLFAVTFAVSGIQLSVMRLVSEELEKGNPGGAVFALRKCTAYALIFGISAFCILFFGANDIASHILQDMRTYRCLRILAVALPFIALSNVLSGYFHAVKRVGKNASANIIELFVKIALTVTLLSFAVDKGVEMSCIALTLGSAASEALSFFYLLSFYLFDKKRHMGKVKPQKEKSIRGRMLKIALPIALSSYLRSGLVTVEHILIPVGLRKFGEDYSTSLASYGVVHGMVFPLILFPSAICQAFAGLIVPEMSELSCKYGKVYQNRHICYIVRRSLTLALTFGIGTAGILYVFAKPLGMFVYHSAEAARYIGLFSVLVPVMYLDTAVDGMLKGLGQQLHSMIYNIIDATMSVLFVWLLVPKIGIGGYVICIFITEIVNLTCSISRLFAVTGAAISFWKAIFLPLLSVTGATSFAVILLHRMPIRENSLPLLCVGILLSVMLYCLLLYGTGACNKDDIRWIKKAVTG